MKKLIIGLFVLLILFACADGNASSLQGQWTLVSYSSDARLTPAAPGVKTFIEFKDGQLNGNMGCNGFGGEYSISGDTITFGPIMSTMMFCEGPVGEQETATLIVLQGSVKFTLDGNTLLIVSPDGTSSIALERK